MDNNTGWRLGLGALPAQYVPDPRGSGRSLLIGLPSGQRPGRTLWSSARQTVTIPASQRATLSLKYLLRVDPQPGTDLQFIAILGSSGATLKRWDIAGNRAGQWRDFSQDISQFAGQTVQVYAGVMNDGFGGATNMVVDEVILCVK
jgi:hypothetical protein